MQSNHTRLVLVHFSSRPSFQTCVAHVAQVTKQKTPEDMYSSLELQLTGNPNLLELSWDLQS